MAAEIRVGTVGFRFERTFVDEDGAAIDISTATTKQIIFRKPDGTGAAKDGTFTTDGSDGKLFYETEAGFLDSSGDWVNQGYVVLSGGNVWYTDIDGFTVEDNLPTS